MVAKYKYPKQSVGEKKRKAQDNLMHAMMNAFYDETLSDNMKEIMHKEVNRIEKLFGYELNSWTS